jgi:D-arabinose 1-dehydrogenase-like Zn-dependent alcohol dehydrogenase
MEALSSINRAFERVVNKDVPYRVVIDMAALKV